MQNKQSIELIEKIQKDINSKKFNSNSIIEDLKKIRENSMELNTPTLIKSLRLAYEHIEQNDAFLIEIPNDEPLDGNVNSEISKYAENNNLESFDYFLSLVKNYSKKSNLLDLKEYNQAFINF